ncbi:hypothetical protein [Psychrobacter sanguinis]|uniref:hypothetical protein n=1 Tax=Psychrobacter sanguinis TaxID=861445 RepID=UPI0019180C49|nr:hypothetical protein [Psychrobacter sanguinis]MCC3344502.1 hypothetical protein [Psychrobacter sanguinis]
MKKNTTKQPDNKTKPKKSGIVGAGVPWLNKGTNQRLIAKIRPVSEDNVEGGQGKQTFNPIEGEPIIAALFEDGEFAVEAQYSTPFETSNPEGRMPNTMGMIQSGELPASMYSVLGLSAETADEGTIKNAAGEVAGKLVGLKDRSTFTKINSRQIFTSTNSVRITGTLVFQAWADANREVELALNILQQWVSPRKLSDASLIVGAVADGIEGMFPSIIPPLVQFQYGGRTYRPMFIESLSAPITSPMTKNGDRVAIKAQITLLSLTAWDKFDIAALRPKKGK